MTLCEDPWCIGENPLGFISRICSVSNLASDPQALTLICNSDFKLVLRGPPDNSKHLTNYLIAQYCIFSIK